MLTMSVCVFIGGCIKQWRDWNLLQWIAFTRNESERENLWIKETQTEDYGYVRIKNESFPAIFALKKITNFQSVKGVLYHVGVSLKVSTNNF